LTDISGGFVAVTMYSEDIDSAFSLRDSLSGTHGGVMLIGRSGEGDDTLAAHAQFGVSGAPPDSAVGVKYAKDAGFTVRKSAYVYFSADSAPDGRVALLRCGFLANAFSPVRRAENGAYDPVACDSDSCGGGLLFDSAGTASARLDSLLTDSLYSRRADVGGRDTLRLAFSIAGYGGAIRRLGSPYIILVNEVKRGAGLDTVWHDTIMGPYVRYTAFETAADSAWRSGPVREDSVVYTSQRTQRTAVFKVRMGKAYAELGKLALSGGNSKFLQCVVSVRQRLSFDGAGDPGAVGWVDTAGVAYRAFVSAVPFRGELELRDNLRATGASAVYPSYNTVEFEAGEDDKPDYIYIYLRPVADGGVIRWAWQRWAGEGRQTPKVEAVFTPSRLSR
jgi:hypothetical protein